MTSRSGSYYANELLRLRCGPDMLRLRLFPNVKEIEESFAAFHAVSDLLYSEEFGGVLGCNNVVALVPGDGKRPRTAATMAFRTAWRAHSIDPIADEGETPRRCWQHRVRVEDADVEQWTVDAELVVVLAVHSHVPLDPLWRRLDHVPALIAVVMPCCLRQDVEAQAPALDYEDSGVSSPKCRILVWHRGLRILGRSAA